MDKLFPDIKIPCLQTFDQLKAICRENNLRLIIPNSTEKKFKEAIRLKRDREDKEKLEQLQNAKRELDDQDQTEASKAKRLKIDSNNTNSPKKTFTFVKMEPSSTPTNSSAKKNIVVIDLEDDEDVKIIEHVSSSSHYSLASSNEENEVLENGQDALKSTAKSHNQSATICTIKPTTASQTKTQYIEDLEEIEKLSNLKSIKDKIEFWNNLKEYADQLNDSLIKSNCLPITVRNQVDNELPARFRFVNEYDLRHLDNEVIEQITNSIQRCDCKYLCMQSKTRTATCCFSNFSHKCFYDALGKIKTTIRTRGPIVECTNKCKCDNKCPNRVIQHGTKVKLGIFKTNDGRGWGLKALQKIPKNMFICTYRGEVITSEDALKRQAESPFGDRYFFNLDYTKDLDFKYVVDATNTSSLGRFINHSCLPNCETFVAYVEHFYEPIPVIAFFSNRFIREHEELTIDYFMGAEVKEKITDDADQPTTSNNLNNESKIDCRCGNDQCRNYGFLT